MDIIRRNVRHSRIEVKPDGQLKVVVPNHVDVEALLERKRPWIERKLREIEELTRPLKGREHMLLLNGEFFNLQLGQAFGICDSTVTVPSLEKLRQRFRELLRAEMEHKVRLFSSLLGVSHGRMFIRRQKSKWASCSAKGNLSFNLRMVALPEQVREYVAIHELAHLREPRHSKRFWRLVSSQYPDYKQAEQELKKYWLMLELNEPWQRLAWS